MARVVFLALLVNADSDAEVYDGLNESFRGMEGHVLDWYYPAGETVEYAYNPDTYTEGQFVTDFDNGESDEQDTSR